MNPRRWSRLSHQLDTLLELGAEERARYLARLAHRAPALADELRSALAAQREMSQAHFLERSALCGSVSSLQGRTVGGFTVERLIGCGPSAEVWLARYPGRTAEHRVALKLWNPTSSAVPDIQRLAKESRELSRLGHPNIVPVLAGGVWNNRPYLVMEYIAGVPIDQWCDTQRLSITSRIALFMDVVDAVAYAHETSLVHGNLKPTNIMVTAGARVKVMELGIVRMLLPVPSGTGAELSHVARLVFAPTYAAPEQLKGGALTPAADIYALGTLLHSLLVGAHPRARPFQSPWESPHLMSGEIFPPASQAHSASTAVLQISRDTAAHRSSTPEQLARELRGGLDRIIAKATKERPSERYSTVEAFAKRLHPYAGRSSPGERHGILGRIIRRLLTRDRI